MTNTSSLNNKYAEENKNRFNPFQKLILIFTLVCVQLLWANDKESLKADFLSLAKKYNIPAADIYVSIGTTKESILKHNSETKVIPASLTKLMVASAVLDTMPANLQFSTYLKAKSYRASGIYDEVCLMGGGDPSFVSEDMWKLVNQALRANLKQVSAKILVDESYFDDEYFHEGRQSQRVSRAYDAPVSAMSFNWNSVNLYIRPGDSRASGASVFADPKNDYIVLKADVKTGSKEDLKVERIELADGRNQFNVSGSIAIGAPEKAIYRAISKPSLWAGYNLKSFLNDRDIDANNVKIEKSECKNFNYVISEVKSKPLYQIVSDMNKFSNNYVTEMLVKNLAATVKTPASMEDGLVLIYKHLAKLGLDKSKVEISSVSGFSHQNKMSTDSLLKVLEFGRNEFAIYPELASSLPLAAFDGTLKSRMTKLADRVQVRGKTGLLNGVAGLAGYAISKTYGEIEYVFIYNAKNASKDYEARLLFDAWSERMVK